MTVLYICVRYIGILSLRTTSILSILPVLITDVVSTINWYIWTWNPVIVNAILGVVMIARINAMYQGSKKLFIFLVVTLLACTITPELWWLLKTWVFQAQETHGQLPEEAVLSGYYTCITYGETNPSLNYEWLTPILVWEILALFLVVWNVVMHFRKLRRSQTGSSIGDCLTMLIESHAFYFLAFATVASLRLGSLSNATVRRHVTGICSCPLIISIQNTTSIWNAVYSGIWSIAQVLQMFVLGPRLILSIREYYAKISDRADGGIGMTSIAFQADGGALTGRDVSTGEEV
ncbi:hypothetical protein BDR07DRAFT_1421248 [Suillus spraguei]|nr:hypothetical protein BDR07DRAFT_1421248 [Suillus spraguei]